MKHPNGGGDSKGLVIMGIFVVVVTLYGVCDYLNLLDDLGRLFQFWTK